MHVALQHYAGAVAAVRQDGLIRGHPGDTAERFFALGFSLEQMHQNLCDLVDYVIDTKMPLRDAALSLDGVEAMVGPTSTILNAFALQSLVTATVEVLLARGVTPPVWTSSNVPGGEAANRGLIERYGPRVPWL